jgi:Mn-dependent DtxR family transcriptional regulator
MADNRFIKLTAARQGVLELVETEGAVHRGDVAELFRRNIRTAAKALKDLHALGLLTPIRICEYKLSDAGLAWLDAHRRTL